MSPISPSDSNLALLRLNNQELVQRRLDSDKLMERLNGSPDKKAKLREACEGFESVFIQKMWDQMRKNVQKSGYLHSRDEHMYQGMYDAEFSKKMTQAGGIGLADMLYEQLSQRLGESSRTTSPRNNPRLPIVPAGSAVSGLETPVKPLGGAAGAEGLPLGRTVRPLYEDAPAFARPRPDAAEPAAYDAAAAAPPEPAATGLAAPELAPYDEDLDLDALNLSLLGADLEADSAPVPPQPEEAALSPEDAALLAAALRQNMAEAGRITTAQAPAAGPDQALRFGTPLATDLAEPADSSAGTETNNLSRS